MIGIAITTHNRYDIFLHSFGEIVKYSPDDCHIIVVDDGSDVPVPEADFRFEQSHGIAAAKNKCIELLADKGCTEFFLFDDDTYPIKEDWYLPYVNSPESHLSYTFHLKKDGKDNGRGLIETINDHNIYNAPCGCMLYFNLEVIHTVGGLDINYGKWGFEHASFSDRIYNNKLTTRRYMDIANSGELLYCLDQNEINVPSSDWEDRKIIIRENKSKYYKGRTSKEYIPYRNNQYKGVVVCSYFNGGKDPQRDQNWSGDLNEINDLRDSCANEGIDLIIFHDCLKFDNFFPNESAQVVSLDSDFTPNVFRWLVYDHYMEMGMFDEYDAVFFVDSTDVEVLKNPFSRIRDNFIYSGSEYNQRTTNKWMRETQQPHVKIPNYNWIINVHGNDILLNCGVVGGTKEVMGTFIKGLSGLHEEYSKGLSKSVDMATYNYYCRKYWNDQIVAGINITTKFKEYKYNDISIFKHK